MKDTILVTGGAGYIGSACVKALILRGHDVIVIDNLSKGMRKLVDPKARFYEGDLKDKAALGKVFENRIDAVIHIAAYKAVEESMKDPEKYSDNIRGTLSLLDMMAMHGVKKLIYSSTAAVYGMPNSDLIDEGHPTEPINYYGYTKLASEQLIGWYSRLNSMDYVSLRYFNVAGDSGLGYLDPQPLNVLPIIMEVLTKKREKFVIFGKDYDTRDGTCVRDYIDVSDLIRAHVLALDTKGSHIVNLGTSRGVSVKELVEAASEVTGRELPFEYGERRQGDPAVLVASNERAKQILGWEPEKDIKDMIRSTFRAYESR